jgi:hypothetical protein
MASWPGPGGLHRHGPRGCRQAGAAAWPIWLVQARLASGAWLASLMRSRSNRLALPPGPAAGAVARPSQRPIRLRGAWPSQRPILLRGARPSQRPNRLHIRGAVRVSNPNRLLPNPQRSQAWPPAPPPALPPASPQIPPPPSHPQSPRAFLVVDPPLPLVHLPPDVRVRCRLKKGPPPAPDVQLAGKHGRRCRRWFGATPAASSSSEAARARAPAQMGMRAAAGPRTSVTIDEAGLAVSSSTPVLLREEGRCTSPRKEKPGRQLPHRRARRLESLSSGCRAWERRCVQGPAMKEQLGRAGH